MWNIGTIITKQLTSIEHLSPHLIFRWGRGVRLYNNEAAICSAAMSFKE